jgi:integrase
LLVACDEWQFPLFLTLLFTGMRPGELVHLLLPDDLDLESGWLRIRNKRTMGWQTKTRNQRDIPLLPSVAVALGHYLGGRQSGPLFVQRRCMQGYSPPLISRPARGLEQETILRVSVAETASLAPLSRVDRRRIARSVWRDSGALREDWVRTEFIRVMRTIGLPRFTAPKTLRHTFATILQDANVDPLIRNELMGRPAVRSLRQWRRFRCSPTSV